MFDPTPAGAGSQPIYVLREEQLVELSVVAGWYHAISFASRSAGLALEPWAARFPA